jgi:hypothetical protein
MRIETYKKIYNLKNVLITTAIVHLIAAIWITCSDDTVTFTIGLGCGFFFDFIFFLLVYPIGEILEYRIYQQTINFDRQNNIPAYRYEYSDFNGDYWAIVKRYKRYSIHEEWEEDYNLINREGHLFFTNFCKWINHITLPQDLTGFRISYDNEHCNLLICDGYLHKDISFLVDEPARYIGNFDSDGVARVTFDDYSVNYINLKGQKLYTQNLIGQIKSPDFE